MSLIYTTHEADGIDFLCYPITFGNLSGAVSMLGGTSAVDAYSLRSGAKFSGVASILAENSVRCTFAGWSLPDDTYSVQTRGTPAGYSEQTLLESTWIVKKSAGTKP